MNVAAIIVGIENWAKFTLPLVESIQRHEPDCWIAVIDNASKPFYPQLEADHYPRAMVFQTERACYSKAINFGKECVGDADWYIVLSNDVLCTGPFAHTLEGYGDGDVVGPLMKQIHIEGVGTVDYIEGWAVCIPRRIWEAVGGWDEGYRISSYEDVDLSHSARRKGFGLLEDKQLPFIHLDQKQRFGLVSNYWDSEIANRAYFQRKHGGA